MKRSKAQASVEYIFIVALALMLIVPGTVIFYQYTQSSQKAIVSSQIYKIGNDIVTSADMMYSVGENSWQTVEVNFPASIKEVIVFTNKVGSSYQSELVVRHGTDYVSDAVFFSSHAFMNSTVTDPDDCDSGCPIPVHAGYTKLRIESETDGEIVFRVLE